MERRAAFIYGDALSRHELRLKKIKSQREEERRRTKDGAMSKAKSSTQAAADKQNRVPELLDDDSTASIACAIAASLARLRRQDSP